MEPADEYEYKGHTITIGYEQYLGEEDSPRQWDNLGVMHCAHRNYNLGDEQTDPADMLVSCPTCGDVGSDLAGRGEVPVPVTFAADDEVDRYLLGGLGWTECPTCDTSGEVVDPVRWAVERQGATVVLGLYLYDHSGITMSASTLYRDGERVNGGNPFTCRWDSGMVGVMFDTPATVAMCGTPPELIEEGLHGEVKTYDSYLTGDVYFLRVEGPHCDDSCGNYFIGHDGPYSERFQFMRDEAQGWIDASIEREQQEVAKIRSMMAL